MSKGGGLPFDWDVLVPQLVHAHKVEIVEALSWIGRPLSATDLTKVLENGHTVPGLSHHLRTLAKAGGLELISERPVRVSMERFYFFAIWSPEALTP